MTDPEDKTGRHGKSWADKIPLVVLLAFVAVASGALVEAKFTRAAVDNLATTVKEQSREQTAAIREHADASNKRLRQLEDWRLLQEAPERKRR